MLGNHIYSAEPITYMYLKDIWWSREIRTTSILWSHMFEWTGIPSLHLCAWLYCCLSLPFLHSTVHPITTFIPSHSSPVCLQSPHVPDQPGSYPFLCWLSQLRRHHEGVSLTSSRPRNCEVWWSIFLRIHWKNWTMKMTQTLSIRGWTDATKTFKAVKGCFEEARASSEPKWMLLRLVT